MVRVVLIGPALPDEDAADAGTRYLTRLAEVYAGSGRVVALAPDFTGNADARLPSGVVGEVVTSPRAASLLRRLHLAAARLDPGLPYLPFTAGLLTRGHRRLLAGADVVDLQYAEPARLAGLVRRLAPHARIVATHHDVLSQRYARAADAATGRSRLRWRIAARLARRAERRGLRRCDVTAAFSAKDAALLSPNGAGVVVVDPPMTAFVAGPALADRDPVVLFVGYLARPENDDAARWLLGSVWPRVVGQVPSARLVVVGSGAGPDLEQAVAARTGATLAGFVPDLEAVYATARACVVPLRRGAGVKFKTLEAMAAGVPVVTTTIGAEGVAEQVPDRASLLTVADDPERLARSLVTALLEPDQERADRARAWTQERHGGERFGRAVAAIARG